ncbi:MAG TPA: alpha/beta hydrolase [Pyrinomonadaceae bacterium]|nr:alpha/beta hydrolase [Pyrinomonadaceae bacterium]
MRCVKAFAAVALLLCVWPARAVQEGGGRMVRAGGARLHLEASGSGATTVVLEAGFGGTSEDWGKVQPEVARFARVVSYDRAGVGKSEPGRGPRTATRVARELHEALRAAKLAPPYVLVGQSAGAAYVRVFARLYPKEVAGLVLIVPPQEEFLDWLKAHRPGEYGMPAERLAKLPEGMRAEWEARERTVEEMRAAWPLPRVPVVLLTSERDDQSLSEGISPEALRVLSDARAGWLVRVPGARHVVAKKAGHNVPREEPELVVETIRQVLAETDKSRGQRR